MLSKISSLFSKKSMPSEAEAQIPDGHPRVKPGQATECPFMNSKKGKDTKQSEKCPVTGKAANPEQAGSDSDDEEEKPKGGCPFMGTSTKKKNPNLGLTEEGFDEPFVSKFKYYLSSNKLDFTAMKNGQPPATISRARFDTYPIYLQHSLFYNGEDYKKVRGIECCSRFMAYEQLREKGNKHYNKGRYYQALDYYERAMSLFRWLEYHQDMNKSRVSTDREEQFSSCDEASEVSSKIHIELSQEQAKSDDPFEEMRTKYKQFFVTYCDDNVKVYDGEEMTQTADIDMRKSLLVQVYLNMAAAYMKLHHYSLAQKVLDDGMELTQKVSQLYFRKAQCLALRKDATSLQIKEAKKLIEHALQQRPQQKIYQTANQNILKMLNLHDSEAAYQECFEIVERRKAQVERIEADSQQRVYERAKEIHQIEQRMIKQGKTPQERLNQKVLYQTTEMRILQRMLAKYCRVVQFYTESKNPEQVQLAKKELQQVLRIVYQVKLLFKAEMFQHDGQLGGLQTEKVKKRINIIKTSYAEDIYNKGKFNWTMLEWAIKEIVKEDTEQEKRLKEQQRLAKQGEEINPQPVSQKRDFTKLAYMLVYIPLVVLLVNYLVI